MGLGLLLGLVVLYNIADLINEMMEVREGWSMRYMEMHDSRWVSEMIMRRTRSKRAGVFLPEAP